MFFLNTVAHYAALVPVFQELVLIVAVMATEQRFHAVASS